MLDVWHSSSPAELLIDDNLSDNFFSSLQTMYSIVFISYSSSRVRLVKTINTALAKTKNSARRFKSVRPSMACGTAAKILTTFSSTDMSTYEIIPFRQVRVKVGTETSPYTPIQAGVPQGSVLGATLYLLYTADIPTDESSLTALFADDTEVATRNENYNKAAESLQMSLNKISKWARRWKIAINELKSVRVDFTLRSHRLSPSFLDNKPVPQADSARYLGLHLDHKLNWAEHIRQKHAQLKLMFRKYYWLLGRKSSLSLHSKRTIYTSIIKPIWMYGIQFQNKMWRTITNALWYVTNDQLHADLNLRTMKNTKKSRPTTSPSCINTQTSKQ